MRGAPDQYEDQSISFCARAPCRYLIRSGKIGLDVIEGNAFRLLARANFRGFRDLVTYSENAEEKKLLSSFIE